MLVQHLVGADEEEARVHVVLAHGVLAASRPAVHDARNRVLARQLADVVLVRLLD